MEGKINGIIDKYLTDFKNDIMSWVDNNNNGIWDNGDDLTGIAPYEMRIRNAPYFFNMRDGGLAPSGDFIPLDTHRYVIYVPELNDDGVMYSPQESLEIKDIEPLKTEKMQSFEF